MWHHVRQGSYPGATALREELDRFTAHVRDVIVEPAIGRDLLALMPVHKPALLRQIFAIATKAPASILSPQKIQGRLIEAGALTERDLAGLLGFTRRFPRFQPLLLATPGDRGAATVADRAGIRHPGWDEFLLDGPPGAGAEAP